MDLQGSVEAPRLRREPMPQSMLDVRPALRQRRWAEARWKAAHSTDAAHEHSQDLHRREHGQNLSAHVTRVVPLVHDLHEHDAMIVA